MKKMLLLMTLTISLFGGRYDINYSTIENNGWAKPFNRILKTSTEYDYEAPNYPANHKVSWQHGAVDIIATLDEKIYSIGDGKVVKFYRKKGNTKNMSVMYVQYRTSNNKEFLVIYGHVYAKTNLIEGSKVLKGEYIGNIKRYGSPDHVHFGITNNLNYHGESFGSSNSWTGVVNPLEYLKSNTPQRGISSKYIWHKTGTVYTDTQTDAQFGLQNNSNEAIVLNKVGLSLHGMDRKFIRDVKIKSNQVINANSSYESGILKYTAPSKAGNYFLVSKYQDESGQWFDIGFDEIEITENPNSNSYAGIFDGAGSLVSPKDDCWGCNKDEARMQPHTGTGSTVVFQWWYDSNVCSQIELTSDRDIDVLVRAKGWQDHLTKKEFKVTLGTDPITLKRPNENAKWTTLAYNIH